MSEKPKVLLVATLDSKEVETRFIRERLEEGGLDVFLLDASIRRTIASDAHITPDQIAAAVGTTMPEIRALNHEGKCMALMIEKNIRHLLVYENGKLLGVMSVRDVLKEVVDYQKFMISQLEHYIVGSGR